MNKLARIIDKTLRVAFWIGFFAALYVVTVK